MLNWHTLVWLFLNQVSSPCPPLGRAIKHVKESIFTAESGARRGVPKVLVVLTDGRSQDDVNKVSKEMQMDGEYFTDKYLQVFWINCTGCTVGLIQPASSWILDELYVTFYSYEAVRLYIYVKNSQPLMYSIVPGYQSFVLSLIM